MKGRPRWRVPDLPANRPKVPEVLSLARALYRTYDGGAGCCLHIVLDDNNLRSSDVEFSLGVARERGHPSCEVLAEKLGAMTKTQRRRILTMMNRRASK